MAKTESRRFSFSPEMRSKTVELLRGLGYPLEQPRKLAEAVHKLSNFYIRESGEPTPWSEPWAQAAYLAYYWPLNWVRAQAVLKEGQRWGVWADMKWVIDFGSGISPFSDFFQRQSITEGFYVESSLDAIRLHQQVSGEHSLKWVAKAPPLPKENSGSFGFFSYSLNELSALPRWALNLENLVLIEPSTQLAGRCLMQIRDELLAAGFSVWAPCTHSGACPLLNQSKRDWCHDRVIFEADSLALELEKHLPFHNASLTFSYLLVSRRPEPKRHPWVRTVGDPLPEKGKTRQMICRGEKREFLSWLHRDGPPPEIPRGSLIELSEGFEEKGSELRSRGGQIRFPLG